MSLSPFSLTICVFIGLLLSMASARMETRPSLSSILLDSTTFTSSSNKDGADWVPMDDDADASFYSFQDSSSGFSYYDSALALAGEFTNILLQVTTKIVTSWLIRMAATYCLHAVTELYWNQSNNKKQQEEHQQQDQIQYWKEQLASANHMHAKLLLRWTEAEAKEMEACDNNNDAHAKKYATHAAELKASTQKWNSRIQSIEQKLKQLENPNDEFVDLKEFECEENESIEEAGTGATLHDIKKFVVVKNKPRDLSIVL